MEGLPDRLSDSPPGFCGTSSWSGLCPSLTRLFNMLVAGGVVVHQGWRCLQFKSAPSASLFPGPAGGFETAQVYGD